MKQFIFEVENMGMHIIKAPELVKAYSKLERVLDVDSLLEVNILNTKISPYKYKYIITSVDEYVYSDWGYTLYYDKEFYSFQKLTEKDLIELVIDSSDIEHEAPDHFEMEYEINGVEYKEIEL